MGPVTKSEIPSYVLDALPNSYGLNLAEIAQDPPPLPGWSLPGERERRQIFISTLMGIVACYWNGNKFGARGQYLARDAQADRDVRPDSEAYFVYRARGRGYSKTQRDLGDIYVGHNIAALAVNGEGRLIDFEMNSNAIFDSSMEHAEAMLVRRLVNLAKSWEAQDWVPDEQKTEPDSDDTADEKAAKEARRSNLNGITIYTSLESCAQCAGIMALANIKEVVYLQRDPGMFCIGNILYRLGEDQNSGALHPPLPVAAEVFESDPSYFRLLGQAYERFKVPLARGEKFYIATSGPRAQPDPPSITSFLCTDEVYDIFDHGGRRLGVMELEHPDYESIPGARTNAMVLCDAKRFLEKYVVLRGRRGITHQV